MRIGLVGLGKMGAQIVAKLLEAGHELVVLDVNPEAVEGCVKLGATGATDRQDMVTKLGENPVVWMMIPHQYVADEVKAFTPLLPKGSTLIDGGNSPYKETIEMNKELAEKGIDYIDVGTSGGVMGLKNGFGMMIGGSEEGYKLITPILDVLAKPNGAHRRMGGSGSGHYVKMIHNGVEYSQMQSYGEGYELMHDGPIKGIDLAAVAYVWQRGCVVESKLNELVFEVLEENPELDGIDGYVAMSGEGVWTKETADELNIPVPALDAALAVRKASQEGKVSYGTKLMAAMRNKFGGHAINKS